MTVAAPTPQAAAALASKHTQTFPPLLRQLGASLIVSTYQAGQLILLRDQGESLNSHFSRDGQADGHGRRRQVELAIGSDCQLWTFWNMPAVAPKLEPQGSTMRRTCRAACT